MAIHSSVLAWRIPGMGEPGGLPSMGSRRVGNDWSDLAAAAAAIPFSRGSSQPRYQTQVSCIAGRFFTIWAAREAPTYRGNLQKTDSMSPKSLFWETRAFSLMWIYINTLTYKIYDTERFTPRSVGGQYATGEDWRNISRSEEAKPKRKQHPIVDVTGDGSKVRFCKEQYCIGNWKLSPWIKVNWKWSNRRW